MGSPGSRGPRAAWVPLIEPCDHDCPPASFIPTRDVEEDERDDWSGLWDAQGRRLYHAREPLGFHDPRDYRSPS